jgi:hypothetical protein
MAVLIPIDSINAQEAVGKMTFFPVHAYGGSFPEPSLRISIFGLDFYFEAMRPVDKYAVK